jgi:hypothetical protein
MTNYLLSINNKEVFEFYQKHNLHFEQMNMLFYNILQQIMTTTDTSFNSSIANILLDKITQLEKTIQGQQNEITNKLNEYKKDYLNDVKLILMSNNVEYITPLIRETNNHLLDKTTLIINELIPKGQISVSKDIEHNFQMLQSQLTSETNKLLSTTINQKTIDDFMNSSNSSMSQILNNLTTIIMSTETRLENKLTTNNSKIENIQQMFQDNNHTNHKLQNSVTEMLKKFEKGVGKGNVSENIVYNILLNLYPCAQVDYVGNEQKESGDIILTRTNKPKILIENKDHDSCNVPKSDVEKFIRDCDIQKCCGIMLSQNKGIANKSNYELQINDGNVLLYVHNVNYEPDKIKTAIDIVENFKLKYDEMNINYDGFTVDKNTLDEINKEFNLYTTQRHALLKMVKDFNDKINDTINGLKLPNLETYLGKHYAVAYCQNKNVCIHCNKYVNKSMAQHLRHCLKNSNTVDEQIDEVPLIVELIETKSATKAKSKAKQLK